VSDFVSSRGNIVQDCGAYASIVARPCRRPPRFSGARPVTLLEQRSNLARYWRPNLTPLSDQPVR
jgi:hypothetical protein